MFKYIVYVYFSKLRCDFFIVEKRSVCKATDIPIEIVYADNNDLSRQK